MESYKGAFPSLEEFKIFLEEDEYTTLTSSLKSMYRFITRYFADKEFNKAGFRLMLNDLHTGYVDKNPLKRSTLNRYIQTGNLISKFLGLSMRFKQYRNVDNEAEPLGDLISDKEMKQLSVAYIPRKNTSRKDMNKINLKFQAAFTCMRFSGIPPVDLCNLKWSYDKNTHFEFRRQKTGKLMLVPIVPPLRALLDKLPHYPHNYVFATEKGRMREATLNEELRKRAHFLNINKHVTCYSFRYSMITWCYVNAGEGMIPKISKITGHTVETAMKHYAKFDVKVLIDALYASHPGLKNEQNIDSIKRVITNLLQNLVDLSKFEVKVEISPKNNDKRVIHLS